MKPCFWFYARDKIWHTIRVELFPILNGQKLITVQAITLYMAFCHNSFEVSNFIEGKTAYQHKLHYDRAQLFQYCSFAR